MPSKSETSFGARLLKAQNLATFITSFNNYTPPREEESVVNFNNLLNSVVTLNKDETTNQQNYNTAVAARYNAFREDPDSVFKILAPLRGIIQAQYGKDSLEVKKVATIIAKLRAGKLIKKPATEDTPEVSVSQSEQSYGSSTQFFSDLVQTLGTFAGYNPSNTALQLGTLQTFLTKLNTLNQSVASSYQTLKNLRNDRRKSYIDLSDRVNRIKAYVKGNYGTQSQEYQLIKGIIV